jgi:hypothetical protein
MLAGGIMTARLAPRLHEVVDANSSSSVKLGFRAAFVLRGVSFISWIRNYPAPFFPVGRFVKANRLAAPGTFSSQQSLPEIEILIACAAKDLFILPSAIAGALASSHNPIARISLVVPKDIVEQTTSLASSLESSVLEVVVVPETELVSIALIQTVRDAYGSRFGWVLQQMLRNRFIMHRSTMPTLVVDADTVLCFPRTWIDSEGRQVMTPTWEFNAPYYSYLHMRMGTPANPPYTFVSHHMLMQPGIFAEANVEAKIDQDALLLNAVLEKSSDPNPSSFCLIYEIYAQWLMLNAPETVFLERWSNRFIHRSKQTSESFDHQIRNARERGYCSVSFHSWS